MRPRNASPKRSIEAAIRATSAISVPIATTMAPMPELILPHNGCVRWLRPNRPRSCVPRSWRRCPAWCTGSARDPAAIWRPAQAAEVSGRSGEWRWMSVRQVHSSLVWRDPAPETAGDGMMTDASGVLLGIRVADCVPILLADVRRGVIAAVHAGWRGTVARIVEKAVGELRAQFGSDPADLRAALGPSIRRCCYQVGAEVVEAFAAQFDYAEALWTPAPADPVRERYPMLFMTGAPPGHPRDPRWNYNPSVCLD